MNKKIFVLLAAGALAGCVEFQQKTEVNYWQMNTRELTEYSCRLEAEIESDRLDAVHYSNKGNETGYQMYSYSAATSARKLAAVRMELADRGRRIED